MKTLHLILKHKWYDMIASGEKTEEYRNLGDYWNNRIWKGYQFVCFHRGYTKNTMSFIIKDVVIGFGKKEWGAEPKFPYFVIKLGRRVA